MEDYILIEKATHEGIEIGKRLSKESKPGGVGEWKEKYCKKFGLCDEGKKCQCKAELKFISNLLLLPNNINLKRMKIDIYKNEYGYDSIDCPFCNKRQYAREATKVSPDRLRDLKRHIKNQAKNEALELYCNEKTDKYPHLNYLKEHTTAKIVFSDSRVFDNDLQIK